MSAAGPILPMSLREYVKSSDAIDAIDLKEIASVIETATNERLGMILRAQLEGAYLIAIEDAEPVMRDTDRMADARAINAELHSPY